MSDASAKPARAVALLSGGLDSGVAVGTWRAGGGVVVAALLFDYGQRAADAEARAAATLAHRWSIPFERIPLPWLASAAAMAGSALIDGGAPIPTRTVDDPGDAASAAAVWVPARNVVLLAAAAAIAEARGADVVLTGFNREEAATFADNSAAFVAAMDAALALGTKRRVRVVAPTLDLDKAGIAAAAVALGLRESDFWSCYGSGPQPCGRCESCARSRRAFAARANG